jgi:hypothetical protein
MARDPQDFLLAQKSQWPEMIETPFEIVRSPYTSQSFCLPKNEFLERPPPLFAPQLKPPPPPRAWSLKNKISLEMALCTGCLDQAAQKTALWTFHQT